MRKSATIIALLFLTLQVASFGEPPSAKPKESWEYRTIFTSLGTGGGLTLGLFAGIALFDDAIDSNRKVWTLATISTIGGGVGGYLLGRFLDKRKNQVPPTITWQVPDKLELDLRPAWNPGSRVPLMILKPFPLKPANFLPKSD
jgi:hypothetical protein